MTTSEILMICLTAVIATAGVIGAVIFNNQLSIMQGQLDEMKSASKQTVELVEATKASADAAKKSADVAREALIATQRAFVFVTTIIPRRGINMDGDTTHWVFEVQWKNSGNTPTKNMFVRMNLLPFDGELPDDFDFKDLGNDNVPVFIGPQSMVGSGQLSVQVADVEAVIAGNKKLFLWGWAEYDDTFKDTPRHRVEYCFDIRIAGEAKTDKNSIQMSMYRRHNGNYDIERKK